MPLPNGGLFRLANRQCRLDSDVEISEFTTLVKRTIAYEGEVVRERSRLDETPCKLLDLATTHEFRRRSSIDLGEGIRQT